MLFAAICRDKPDSLEIRMNARPAHLEHLKTHADSVRLAGPLLADDGETPCGSLLVIEAEDVIEARKILDADPYADAGLFETIELSPWKWVVGNPDA
ncbi:YciI family protein [Tepidamorphus sp. 3E244]|uniref:YciI family protein n=1 Tax=Tepidamorphus sp. 3E244 TaxID=3385498 RepID=UPI0038FC7A13